MVEWACQIYAHCGKMDEKKLTRGNSISQDNQTLHTTVTSDLQDYLAATYKTIYYSNVVSVIFTI